MLDNLLRPYMPHILTARDKCNAWGGMVLQKLEDIHWAIQDASNEVSPSDYVNRINGVQQAGAQQIGPVPQNQAWILDYVTSSAAWTLSVNGALFASSTNAYVGNPLVLLPGETAQLNLTGTADYAIQVTRKFENQHPRRARTDGGKEGRYGSIGPAHENERDIMDTGQPQLPLPPAGGASDV